jgi:hypothetical protein
MKLSADSLASHVLLRRVVKPVPCVVLEGSTDTFLFEPFLERSQAQTARVCANLVSPTDTFSVTVIRVVTFHPS